MALAGDIIRTKALDVLVEHVDVRHEGPTTEDPTSERAAEEPELEPEETP